MTMKAMILPALGAPLRLATVPVPKIGPNDVLLRVRAAGVGLPVVIMTRVPGRVTSFPRIPGHEVAGEVVELGSEVAHVKIGDRVTCHFYLTCGVCRFCRSGRETLCPASRSTARATSPSPRSHRRSSSCASGASGRSSRERSRSRAPRELTSSYVRTRSSAAPRSSWRSPGGVATDCAREATQRVPMNVFARAISGRAVSALLVSATSFS